MTTHDVPLSDVAQGEVFTKHVDQPDSAYAEAAGLNWLGAASSQVVKVVAVSDHTISTTKIAPERPTRAAAEAAGVELARIHLAGAPAFGSPPLGWPGPNFIGTQIQACEPDPDWARFYITQRVLPFYRKAADAGNIHDPERTVERACELIAAATWESAHVAPGVAGRIHGDLWSGNLLYGRPVSKNVLTETALDDAGADNGEVDGGGVEPFFIDPAAHGGHPETDLAMLALFGTPFIEAVFEGYQSVRPLADDWQDYIPVHQLHPLAVHAVTHGPSYGHELLRCATDVVRLLG